MFWVQRVKIQDQLKIKVVDLLSMQIKGLRKIRDLRKELTRELEMELDYQREDKE